MKKKNGIALVLSIAIILSCMVMPSLPVNAGSNILVLDSSSLENSAKWNNVSGDVVVEGEKLIFPNDSTDQTKFITKIETEKDSFFEELATAECSLKLTQLPAGQKFILAFGLSSIEAESGESGNVELIFTNESGIKASVLAYGEDGTAITICEPISAGLSLNKTATVKAKITTDQCVEVYINSKKICTGDLPVDGEGRFGFLQTGECGAEITNLAVSYYKYDRPENTNIKEDFEKDSLNKAVLTAGKSIGGGTVAVEEYNGGQVLNFKNVEVAYLGTKHQYSNFEMTFDVPYIRTTPEYDANGNVKYTATGNFGISFGCEQSSWYAQYGYTFATDLVVFEGQSVYSYNQRDLYRAKHPYWQEEEGFSVKITVVDGTVTAFGKWLEETEYQTLLSYELPEGTPTGYVHFWIPVRANMAIDNVVINNLDDNPSLTEVEYQSAEVMVPANAEYVPFERVYASETDEEEQEGLWYLWLPGASVILGASALIVTVVISKKGKKTKEGTVNEE